MNVWEIEKKIEELDLEKRKLLSGFKYKFTLLEWYEYSWETTEEFEELFTKRMERSTHNVPDVGRLPSVDNSIFIVNYNDEWESSYAYTNDLLALLKYCNANRLVIDTDNYIKEGSKEKDFDEFANKVDEIIDNVKLIEESEHCEELLGLIETFSLSNIEIVLQTITPLKKK